MTFSEDGDNSKTTAGSPPTTKRMAEQLLRANLLNLAKKLKEGKILTPAEVKMLSDATDAASAPESDGFAKNMVDLAEAMGVERHTIKRWLGEPENPGRRSDGRYSIAEWRVWAEKHGKKLDDNLPSQTVLKTKNLLLQNERLEHNLKVSRRKLVPMDETEELGGRLGSAIRKVVTSLHTLAPSIVGLTVTEAAALLREKEDEILGQLFLLDEGLLELKTPKESGASDDGDD